MADGGPIFIRITPDKLTDDAIDDYAEQLWQELAARLKGDT